MLDEEILPTIKVGYVREVAKSVGVALQKQFFAWSVLVFSSASGRCYAAKSILAQQFGI